MSVKVKTLQSTKIYECEFSFHGELHAWEIDKAYAL